MESLLTDWAEKPANFNSSKVDQTAPESETLKLSREIYYYFFDKFMHLLNVFQNLTDVQLKETVDLERIYESDTLLREEYSRKGNKFVINPQKLAEIAKKLKSVYEMHLEERADLPFENTQDSWEEEMENALSNMMKLKFDVLTYYSSILMKHLIDIENIATRMQLAKIYRALEMIKLLANNEYVPNVVKKIIVAYLDAIFLLRLTPTIRKQATQVHGTSKQVPDTKVCVPQISLNIKDLDEHFKEWSSEQNKPELSDLCKMTQRFLDLIQAYKNLLCFITVHSTHEQHQNNLAKEGILKILTKGVNITPLQINKLRLAFNINFMQCGQFAADCHIFRGSSVIKDLEETMSQFMRILEYAILTADMPQMDKIMVGTIYHPKKDGSISSIKNLTWVILQEIKNSLINMASAFLDSERNKPVQKYVNFCKSQFSPIKWQSCQSSKIVPTTINKNNYKEGTVNVRPAEYIIFNDAFKAGDSSTSVEETFRKPLAESHLEKVKRNFLTLQKISSLRNPKHCKLVSKEINPSFLKNTPPIFNDAFKADDFSTSIEEDFCEASEVQSLEEKLRRNIYSFQEEISSLRNPEQCKLVSKQANPSFLKNIPLDSKVLDKVESPVELIPKEKLIKYLNYKQTDSSAVSRKVFSKTEVTSNLPIQMMSEIKSSSLKQKVPELSPDHDCLNILKASHSSAVLKSEDEMKQRSDSNEDSASLAEQIGCLQQVVGDFSAVSRMTLSKTEVPSNFPLPGKSKQIIQSIVETKSPLLKQKVPELSADHDCLNVQQTTTESLAVLKLQDEIKPMLNSTHEENTLHADEVQCLQQLPVGDFSAVSRMTLSKTEVPSNLISTIKEKVPELSADRDCLNTQQTTSENSAVLKSQYEMKPISNSSHNDNTSIFDEIKGFQERFSSFSKAPHPKSEIHSTSQLLECNSHFKDESNAFSIEQNKGFYFIEDTETSDEDSFVKVSVADLELLNSEDMPVSKMPESQKQACILM